MSRISKQSPVSIASKKLFFPHQTLDEYVSLMSCFDSGIFLVVSVRKKCKSTFLIEIIYWLMAGSWAIHCLLSFVHYLIFIQNIHRNFLMTLLLCAINNKCLPIQNGSFTFPFYKMHVFKKGFHFLGTYITFINLCLCWHLAVCFYTIS